MNLFDYQSECYRLAEDRMGLMLTMSQQIHSDQVREQDLTDFQVQVSSCSHDIYSFAICRARRRVL